MESSPIDAHRIAYYENTTTQAQAHLVGTGVADISRRRERVLYAWHNNFEAIVRVHSKRRHTAIISQLTCQ